VSQEDVVKAIRAAGRPLTIIEIAAAVDVSQFTARKNVTAAVGQKRIVRVGGVRRGPGAGSGGEMALYDILEEDG